MNMFFWKKHQNTTLEEAKEMLERSHREIMQLAERFSNEELFAKGVFDWVGNSALGSYFVSNTSSHYAWALKKLKAHRKNCKTGDKKEGAQNDSLFLYTLYHINASNSRLVKLWIV